MGSGSSSPVPAAHHKSAEGLEAKGADTPAMSQKIVISSSMRQAVNDPRVQPLFMQHCKDMYCEELFEFYLDVQEIRALYLESIEKKTAKLIKNEAEIMEKIVATHNLYLKDASEKLVNIKPKVREVVIEGDVQESFNKLVAAQEDTLVLMRTSQYRSFLEGPLATNLVVGESSYMSPPIPNRGLAMGALDLMASTSIIKVNARRNDPDDLREALKVKRFQELARLHMTTQHCEEILEFYLAAEELVGADSSEPSAEDIKKCFSRFLCEGAPRLVCGLEADVRKSVLDALGDGEGDVSPALQKLTEAQTATYDLMRAGFWFQFLSCDDGKRLLFNE